MKTLFASLLFVLLAACGGESVENITVEDDDNLLEYEIAELHCIIDEGSFRTNTYEDLETGIITYEGVCIVYSCETMAVDEDVNVLPSRCNYLKPACTMPQNWVNGAPDPVFCNL